MIMVMVMVIVISPVFRINSGFEGKIADRSYPYLQGTKRVGEMRAINLKHEASKCLI